MICLLFKSLIHLLLYAMVLSASGISVDELHQKAVDAFQTKQHDKALNFLQEAISMEPTNSALLNTAGVLLNTIGEIDSAADYFATSLKVDPTGFNANYNAANLVHFAIFDNNLDMTDALDSSIGYYKNAIEAMFSSNQTNASIPIEEQISILNDASVALKKASRNSEAIELLNKVLDIDPNNVQAMGNLALAYLDAGAIESAYRISLTAIEHDQENVEIRKNHEIITQELNSSKSENTTTISDESLKKNDSDVIFGMSFEHQHTHTKKNHSINIELKRTDDPVAIVNELQSELGLDLLTYRWLHCTFNHALSRLKEDIVLERVITIDEKDLPSLIVRYGDDLFALSRSYAYQHKLGSEATDAIYNNLVDQLPQHSDLSWVNTRKRQLNLFSPGQIQNSGDYLSASRQQYETSGNCRLTLAIMTTGKLDFFYNLVQKLPTAIQICEVIVFDDASSESDRVNMVTNFPQFNFITIPKQDKGHAKTLNKMLRLVKTNYLLYLNDLWEPLNDAGLKIERALTLLDGASTLGMPIAQVLMNEQSTRSCTLGTNLTDCRNSRFYGKAGWKRTVMVDGSSFDFLEHEFGTQYLDHESSSYWPGFSSHYPALWNLKLLTSNVNNIFNESDENYDALFSLQIWQSGMTTVHLPDVGFRYIGQ